MLGTTIREARIRKGLTQARLARLASVSRRHLAALEKGANVSVLVLSKVAGVLELTDIDLGDITLHATRPATVAVNFPLLTETLQEAQSGALRTQALLARAEDLLGQEKKLGFVAHFPRLLPRVIDVGPRRGRLAAVADSREAGSAQIAVSGEVRQGAPLTETYTGEMVVLPAGVIDKGEIVFRARGNELRAVGIEEGDLLIVELRPKGRAATGELVIGKAGDDIYLGRWWSKHGEKRLMTDEGDEIALSGKRPVKVLAAVNQIIRPSAS